MRYISTRGEAPELNFESAVLTGLARDGGLYVPATLPSFTPAELTEMASLSYVELAKQILTIFAGDYPTAYLHRAIDEAYAGFHHPAIAPLCQLDHNLWVAELFHGPTLAFKDFALQLLGRLLEQSLRRTSQEAMIVGATSGDTGSAAIEGCRNRKNIRIVILHPHGRVSEVQRRQMTTVLDENVLNIAVEGSFDDCQAMVKDLFNDTAFRDEYSLAAVNSINWARIAAQVVYYFYTALALGAPARPISFSVPTGNFGDVYAGYIAAKMGLPVHRLTVATNRNDILVRFLATGEYRASTVTPTIAPSMDIQVASNFERLLHDLLGPQAVRQAMQDFAKNGVLSVPAAALAEARKLFSAVKVDETDILATIQTHHANSGYILDPHTAIGVKAAVQEREEAIPMVVLGTASPAKFPDAVVKACGVFPAMPAPLGDLLQREERYRILPNTLADIKTAIRDFS